VPWRTGKETEGVGELPGWNTLEFDVFDAETEDQFQNVEGKMVRFSALPDPIALNAERKPLGSFEARTGAPALEGTPHGVGEFELVPRQAMEFLQLGI